MEEAKTIITDIDGTILYHHGSLEDIRNNEPILLEKVKDRFDEWISKDYVIVIMTARPESFREETEQTLDKFGLKYHSLLMGMSHGERIIINDQKSYNGWEDRVSCSAIEVKRNGGFADLNI